MEEVAPEQNQVVNNVPKKNYRFLKWFGWALTVLFILYFSSFFRVSLFRGGPNGAILLTIITLGSISGSLIFLLILSVMAIFSVFRNKIGSTIVKNKVVIALDIITGALDLLFLIWLFWVFISVSIGSMQPESRMVLLISPFIFILSFILFLIARSLEKKNKQ